MLDELPALGEERLARLSHGLNMKQDPPLQWGRNLRSLRSQISVNMWEL